MDIRSAAFECDSTASRGQAALRRLLREHTFDRTITPVIGAGIEPSLGSVFARGVSPVRNIRFSDLKTSDPIVLPLHVTDDDEGRMTPDDSGLREDLGRNDRVEYPIIHEDSRTRSSEQYAERMNSRDIPLSDRQQEDLDSAYHSSYVPGDFRYILTDHQLAQEKKVKAARAAKLAARSGLSPTVSSHPHESRTRQSDWARIRQEHYLMDTSSFLGQAQIPSQLRSDPSLRINNGERRMPSNEGIFPPSSRSVYVERESRGARWEEDLPEFGSSPYVVPERFRAGRESSSVILNVTVRDSKRPRLPASVVDLSISAANASGGKWVRNIDTGCTHILFENWWIG